MTWCGMESRMLSNWRDNTSYSQSIPLHENHHFVCAIIGKSPSSQRHLLSCIVNVQQGNLQQSDFSYRLVVRSHCMNKKNRNGIRFPSNGLSFLLVNILLGFCLTV